METTVKVKAVEKTGKQWTSQQGKTYDISKVTLEDGRTGETMSSKFEAGKEAVALIIEKEYQGKKNLSFKYVRDPQAPAFQKTSFVKGGESRNESFALSYAKDIYVAHIEKENDFFKLEHCLQVADAFKKWLNENK